MIPIVVIWAATPVPAQIFQPAAGNKEPGTCLLSQVPPGPVVQDEDQVQEGGAAVVPPFLWVISARSFLVLALVMTILGLLKAA